MSFLKPLKNKFYDIFIIFVTIIVTYLLSFLSIFIGNKLGLSPEANSIIDVMTVVRLIKVCISLIEKEIITLAIFLSIFNILSKKLTNRKSLVISLILSSVLFGLMHFRAYNFNLYQMIVVIGLTRIPFSILFLKTKTLRSAIYAHIIYDLLIFLLFL